MGGRGRRPGGASLRLAHGELVFYCKLLKSSIREILLNASMARRGSVVGRLGLTFAKLHVMPVEKSRLYKFFFFGIGFQSYYGVNHGIDYRW